jgi:hypothetical protein
MRVDHGRGLLVKPEVHAAWAPHEQHDRVPTPRFLRDAASRALPGARMHRHLFWRYSIVWTRPA